MVGNREHYAARWRLAILTSILSTLVLLASIGVADPLLGQTGTAVECGKCHADRVFLTDKATTLQGGSALYVPDSAMVGTPHEQFGCVDCHGEFGDGYPHDDGSVTVQCQDCHRQAGTDWSASIHAASEAVEDAPDCVACHGPPHDIQGADDRRSPTHPLNVTETCGSCHADPSIISSYFTSPEEAQARVAVDQYFRNVHGTALSQAGLAISATCNDCHGAHLVLPADSTGSSVHRDNIVTTCGTCHIGIIEVYEAGSAHGSAYMAGSNSNGVLAPTCVDCHTSHQTVHVDDPEWFLGISATCGNCHEHLWETYLDTYHGQVTDLGFGLTAKCSDCHTAHNMRPASDIESSVYPLNLVETCARCHPKANDNFVRYFPHGDTHDRRRYPQLFWPWLLMTTLLIGVWAFFGVHSIMWVGGVAIERVLRRSGKRTPGKRPRDGGGK